jgi:hypothetical protein
MCWWTVVHDPFMNFFCKMGCRRSIDFQKFDCAVYSVFWWWIYCFSSLFFPNLKSLVLLIISLSKAYSIYKIHLSMIISFPVSNWFLTMVTVFLTFLNQSNKEHREFTFLPKSIEHGLIFEYSKRFGLQFGSKFSSTNLYVENKKQHSQQQLQLSRWMLIEVVSESNTQSFKTHLLLLLLILQSIDSIILYGN